MAHIDDATLIAKTRNLARYFTEQRQVAWIALLASLLWGVMGYFNMPQRKDPDIPVVTALVITSWPGMDAERIEDRVTRRIEAVVSENKHVETIRSISRTNVSYVYVELKEGITETGEIFDDIMLRLNQIRDLPEGAGPIQFIKDFGSTAGLMLTVASPRLEEVQVSIRAEQVRAAIERLRAGAAPGQRTTVVYNFPPSISAATAVRPAQLYLAQAAEDSVLRDSRLLVGPTFVGVDGITELPDSAILTHLRRFIEERLRVAELHPDAWQPAIVRDPAGTRASLMAVAGDKYSHQELERLTDVMKRTFQTVPQVSKVERLGVLDEQVTLSFSQERLASYGITLGRLRDVLLARNTALGGGQIEVGGRSVALTPTGEFQNEREIGGVIVGSSGSGVPLYLRDLVDVSREYQSPPRYLNQYSWVDSAGNWHQSRAVTLALQMRPGEKIGVFGHAVDSTLTLLRDRLPPDLIMARTSDQPMQVEEQVHLLMSSLWEAVFLVVVVALIGFWEWRSALLLALSIPITLAMTFGMASMLNIDLQQVSIASLIIALGLLVDVPVVAGDAIKRELDDGKPRLIASWLGPTKLARAMLYATITNIVAYLPLLLLTGNIGQFLYSMPIVLTCSLVAALIVSKTFIPLLSYYLLRPSRKPPVPIEERRRAGFTGWYYRVGSWAIQHRWRVAVASLGFLVLGGFIMSRLKPQFFPKDLQYLSYVEIWLPEDAPLSATREVADRAEQVIQSQSREYFAHHASKHGEGGMVSLTTFVGGGGPRFWYSFAPEPRQSHYALIVMETRSKWDTPALVRELQETLSREIPGARVDVRELENGPPVGVPVAIRLSGDHMPTLRALSVELMGILRRNPYAERVHDDWGSSSLAVDVAIDPDRANQAGLTNADVAVSTAVGLNGLEVTSMYRGDQIVPVIARLRMEERAQLADLRNLYVYSSQGGQKVSLPQIATLETEMRPETDQAPEPVPHRHGAGVPPHWRAPLGGAGAFAEGARRLRRQPAARRPPGDRGGVRGAAGGLRRDDAGTDHQHCADLHRPDGAVPERDQAVHRLRGDSLRLRRRGRGTLGDGFPVRVHGLPRDREPGGRDREPRDRAVRLHRGGAGERRGAGASIARCRHPAASAGDDHGGRDAVRPGAAGNARRPDVGATLLRPDRRTRHRDGDHAAPGAGVLLDRGEGPEGREVGEPERAAHPAAGHRTGVA